MFKNMFQCNFCLTYVTARNYNLTTNEKTCPKNPQEALKNDVCSMCGKHFSKKGNLTKHMKVHHKIYANKANVETSVGFLKFEEEVTCSLDTKPKAIYVTNVTMNVLRNKI